MAKASRKHFGPGRAGQTHGNGGPTTHVQVERIPNSGVLSNRDKSQHDKARGLDGKEIE